MTFEEVVDQAVAMLQRRGRVAYRMLKRQFELDDDVFEDLKATLLYDHPENVSDDGQGLSWADNGSAVPNSVSPPPQPMPDGMRTQNDPSETGGAPLARPAVEAERRQLTVIFCDVVGSTELSGQFDAEDYRELVRAYQTTCGEVIERFDCHLAQSLGDGLLIYSGYPLAHENDAERAVRVGLGILQAMTSLNERLENDKGLRLAVRVGIHTGPVVVGEVGAGTRQEQLALGEVPNVAARIQGLAEPDTVVISETTHRLIQGYFDCKELGDQTLRGVAESVAVYQVLSESGAQGRLDITSRYGLTPLVGREQEASLLRERWDQVKNHQSQVVLLSGEAGIGKSRLVQALKDHVTDEAHTRLECRSSPYFTNSALYPIIDMVQRTLQFQADDTPEQKLEKLEQHLGQYRLLLEESVQLFAPLLSLSIPEDRYASLNLSPQRQRQKTLETIVTITLELAERQPVLFILEDAHWLDVSTQELMELLIDQVPTSQVLTLITYRPEFQPPWSNRSYLTQMTLNRLSRIQIESIATQVADGKALPTEVLDQLVHRTDGVPLYVEEMTKSVLESGVLKEADGHYELTGSVSSLSTPSTLQDSLMARLDRLVTAKAVAQYASVIGRQFSYDLLHAVSELNEATLQQELGRLVEAELVYQRGVIPHATYLFKHVLVQDTAYESLLRSTRQGYHRRIAEVLEQQFPEVADQQPELLAYHCTEAGLDEQAVTYWHQAGQRAQSRSAHVEAASHLTAALDVLQRMPDRSSRTGQELRLHLALGFSLIVAKGNGSPDVEQTYLRARELCEQLDETKQLARVFIALHGHYINRAQHDSAFEMAIHLRELAERVNDSISLLVGHHAVGVTLYYQGKLTVAHHHLEHAISLDQSQRTLSVSPAVALRARTDTYSYSALVLWALGYPEQALNRGQEALTLARQYPNAFNLAATCDFVSQLYHRRGEVEQALELLDTSLRLSVDHQFPHWLATGATLTGWTLAAQGRHKAGITKMQEGITARLDMCSAAGRTWELCLLAEAYGRSGQYLEGLNVLSEAQLFIEQTGDEMYAAEVPRLKGELLLRQSAENAIHAETCFHQALEIARSQQSKSFELRAAVSLARLWQSQNNCQDAYDLLASIYNWFTEGFDTADLREAKTLLIELGR